MLKNTLIAGCATLSFVACAHGPTSQSELNTTTDQVSPRTQCLTTGTHIRLESGKCALAPGRVYSQEDIERYRGSRCGGGLAALGPRGLALARISYSREIKSGWLQHYSRLRALGSSLTFASICAKLNEALLSSVHQPTLRRGRSEKRHCQNQNVLRLLPNSSNGPRPDAGGLQTIVNMLRFTIVTL